MKTQKLICGYIGIEKRMMVFRGQGGGGGKVYWPDRPGESHTFQTLIWKLCLIM